MPHYLTRGSAPKKRHTAHRTSPGFKGEGIFYEEVITTLVAVSLGRSNGRAPVAALIFVCSLDAGF